MEAFLTTMGGRLSNRAYLVLEDGSLFTGTSIGAEGHSVAEVVFNTSMTGYQEILSDPSYADQIITLTYPHVGNTGVNDEDNEASRLWSKGLLIRDYPLIASNYRKQQSLSDYLKTHQLIGIADVDTRRLANLLRRTGAQNGCMFTEGSIELEQAKREVAGFSGLQGKDLAQQVSTSEAYVWNQGVWDIDTGYSVPESGEFTVVAYDFGVKRNILRLLVDAGCNVQVVPARTPASAVLAMKPDGIFLSNGPGDPQPCDYAINAIRSFLEQKIPVFGICLGHQLLALAAGASTEKMKFGHHGANHPVQQLDSKRVFITSQNHGFAVNEDSLPANVVATHKSLFDGSLQGIALTDRPAFGFQGHPEGSPGPHDIQYLFQQFTQLMKEARG